MPFFINFRTARLGRQIYCIQIGQKNRTVNKFINIVKELYKIEYSKFGLRDYKIFYDSKVKKVGLMSPFLCVSFMYHLRDCLDRS